MSELSGDLKNRRFITGIAGISWGWLAVLIGSIQLVTGLLLAMYYRPGIPSGYESTLEIVRAAPAGWIIRGAHRYSAYSLVILALVHLFTVFFRRDYRRNRITGWTLGNMFLLIILCAVFTGVLLPLDVTGGCATRVALSLLAAIPLFGDPLAGLLFGFTEGGEFDPYRFYTLHMSFLPLLMALAFWYHRPPMKAGTENPGMKRMAMGAMLIAIALIVLAAYFPPELGEAFDPIKPVTGNVHPVWVFMSAYLLVSYTSSPGPWLILVLLIWLVWMSIPFIERRTNSELAKRALFYFGVLVLASLVLGTVLAYPLTGTN